MSKLIKQKIESRQNHSKNLKIKNLFSLDTISSITKEKPEKKHPNDISLNYLKNYTMSNHPTKTCVNHSHKKIIINEKTKPYYNSNKNILQNLNINKSKYKKYPLKLNYKPSKSLKDLLEDDNLFNINSRANHTRKNTNTKIELFSTNSTLSFLNIKDSNKDLSKPIIIKTKNEIKTINNKGNKNNKKFSATFIENKIRQYIKSHSKDKNKSSKNKLSPSKRIKNNNIKKNKGHDFSLSYVKPINKYRNSSYSIHENVNTNSLKEFYNIKVKTKNTNSTNLLLENISLSLNQKKIKYNNKLNEMNKSKNKLTKKVSNPKYQIGSINNNKKYNLSSLPNLLCNNYMFNFNEKKKESIKKYKNRNSYQNLLEHKNKEKKFHKIKIINNKKIRNLFKNFKKINKEERLIKNNKSEEKTSLCKKNGAKLDNIDNIENKLKTIENGVKSLLNGFYSIYLKAKENKNKINKNSNQ